MEVRLNLFEQDPARVELAYVYHAPKNPAFEAKHKRGFHGHFADKFGIPSYLAKKLKIGNPAGGSNGARWATRIPHPLYKEPHGTSGKEVEIHGKGGKDVPRVINDYWDDGFIDARRGPLTIRKPLPKYKGYLSKKKDEDENDDLQEYELRDYTDPLKSKHLSTHYSMNSAMVTGDAELSKRGYKTLPSYTPPKDVDIDEPEASDQINSVGLVIRDPDGRIWVREPRGHYGGYEHSFPKGHAEKGESLQHAAHREAFEETGLKGKIIGHIGDFRGDMTTTRMYLAERTGGTPVTSDETEAVKLGTPDQVRKLLNRDRDKDILNTYSPDPKEQWLVKHYNGNEDRVATELVANAIYRAMGIKVPAAGEYEHNGKSAVAYPALPGKIHHISAPSEDLGKGYMVDALVANWDVIGLDHDNVLWNNGKPTRLDQGGTLQFRAMGGTKTFGPKPNEVISLMAKGGQAKGTMAVTSVQMRQQATDIYKTLTPQRIDDIIDSAPFDDDKMREEIREALKARILWMKQFGKGMINADEDVRNPTMEESLQDSIEKNFTLYELQHFKDKVPQPTKDKKQLFTLAEKIQQSFKFLMDMGVGLSVDLDARPHSPNNLEEFNQVIQDVKSHPNDYHVIIAPLKTDAASTEKVNGKYGGDWSKLTDVVRGTVLVPHPSNISTALKLVKQHADERGWKISQLDSKLYVDPRRPQDSGPTSAGYRDLSIRLETNEGFQVELQFNWNDMWVAKEENHHYYEEARAIERGANMHPNSAQQKEIDGLNSIMIDAYDRAWRKANGEAVQNPDGTITPAVVQS